MQHKAVTAWVKMGGRRRNLDLLPTHTVPTTHRERLKRLLIIPVKSLFVSRIGLWQESLRMENARLDPVIRIVLYVLQVYADYILLTSQLLYAFCRCS